MALYLNWKQNGVLIRGFDGTEEVNGVLNMPVSLPGQAGAAQAITLSSSAIASGSFDTLQNVRFYLAGDPGDLELVQLTWPHINDQRPELNGGFDISFDNWATVIRFDVYNGNLADPSTWIDLASVAVGLYGITGELGPFDTAHMMIRYTIPPGADQNKMLNIWLEADFDIV